MHVAVDLDDVVLDFVGGIVKSVYVEYGIDVDWDGSAWGESAVALRDHYIWKESGYEDWWGWLRDRDWLWGGVFQAIPGSIGGISRLRQDGHYVEAVTSKPSWAEPQVWRWLGKWRPAFQGVRIVPLGERKTDATSADIMIDDKVQTIHEFEDAGRWGILFDPSGVNKGKCSMTANNWEEVLTWVRRLAG